MSAESALKMKHDGKIYIAQGQSRKETNWKNVETSWSKLVEKLSQTTRTHETIKEYAAMPKSQQAEIKDVGGFVGGMLKGGRRKSDAVQSRQLLTLDADYLKNASEFIDNVDITIGSAYVFYSTHTHKPDKPRGRLIIPLSRPVLPDEYQAIGRWVAAQLGIDLFDDSTFEPHRLMYYPSTSRDGEYKFQYGDAEWLDADRVLASYPDWRDPSYWAESSRVSGERKKLAEKQGDPHGKPGMVGAFCRTYTVTEALETFLSDIYEPCADGKRYTLIGGSTAGGLVIYDGDVFAYSNHATDVISRKLVNAFDLVRLHKFGIQDEDTDPSTPINKLPSFLAMEKFANDDPSTRKTILSERIAEACADFGGEPYDNQSDTNWLVKLETNHKTGAILKTSNNLILILSNDPRLAGCMGLDEFSHRYVLRKSLPWRSIKDGGMYWTDADDACLRNYIERVYGISSPAKLADAMMEVFTINKFHPVRDYLNGLSWDGMDRIDTLLIDYLGADDSLYTRAVTRKTLAAAVARVMQPGIKYDQMLVLVGDQGIGKSTIFAKLAGSWFSDSLTTVHGKEAFEQLLGHWILELGELSATKRSEVESVKLFLSKQVDSFRAAYGRHTSTYARQCVFVGTTNDYNFLKDKTGNRRFLPVVVHKDAQLKDLWKDLDQYEIDQIWSEAVQVYKDGEQLYLTGEVAEQAQIIQEAHLDESPRYGLIQEYLDRLLPDDWETRTPFERRNWLADNSIEKIGTIQRDRVCAIEIWCELFGGDIRNFPRLDQYEINDILRRMPCWKSHNTQSRRLFFSNYGSQRAYVRELEF